MQNAADDTAIVHSPRPGLVLWQERLDRRPCLLIEPVLASHPFPHTVTASLNQNCRTDS